MGAVHELYSMYGLIGFIIVYGGRVDDFSVFDCLSNFWLFVN